MRKTHQQVRDQAYCQGYRMGWYAHRANEATKTRTLLTLEDGEPVVYATFELRPTPDELEEKVLAKTL